MDEKEFDKILDAKLEDLLKPQNRAQRRLMEKKKKSNNKHMDDFKERIKKAAYVDLIQKLRKKNNESEEAIYEDAK